MPNRVGSVSRLVDSEVRRADCEEPVEIAPAEHQSVDAVYKMGQLVYLVYLTGEYSRGGLIDDTHMSRHPVIVGPIKIVDVLRYAEEQPRYSPAAAVLHGRFCVDTSVPFKCLYCLSVNLPNVDAGPQLVAFHPDELSVSYIEALHKLSKLYTRTIQSNILRLLRDLNSTRNRMIVEENERLRAMHDQAREGYIADFARTDYAAPDSAWEPSITSAVRIAETGEYDLHVHAVPYEGSAVEEREDVRRVSMGEANSVFRNSRLRD